MKTRINTRILAAVTLALCGAATAAMLVPRPAEAWTTDQLANLGYTIAVSNDIEPNCHTWTVTGFGQTGDLGSDCDTGFQQRLDQFVAATCPCARPAPTTTTAETPPAAATTTATTTTTTAAPVDTTTTTAAAADTTTAPIAVAAAPTTTATVVTVDTVTAADPPATATTTAGPSVTDLAAQVAALTARVDKLEQATKASWDALVASLQNGDTPAAAALAARSAAMNALYGLGA